MIKVFNSDDKTYETNGNVVLNPTYANIHKEDNGDYYLDLETSIEEDKIKHIEHEEGTTIETTGTTLTDVDTTKEHKFISLYGETQQDSTTGKNKLPSISDFNTTINLVTFIGNKGIYSMSGTTNSNNSASFPKTSTINTYTIQSGDYLHLGNDKTNTNITFSLYFDDNTSQYWSTNTINRIISLDNYVGKTTNAISIYVAKNTNTNGMILKPMICNSSTTTDFEPYTNGASPNPDYPQDIHVVSGDNTIEICGKNLFDKDNANILNAKYGATVTADNNERMLYIHCKPNTTYTLYHIATSPMRNSIGTTQVLPAIGVTIDDGVYSSTSPKTITTNANAKYIVWQFYAMNDSQHTLQDILDSIMIVEGDTIPSTYEAYTGNSQLISLGVENLFDKDNANLLTAYFSNIGTISSTSNVKTLYISCNSNTTYTISKIASTRFRVITTDTTPNIGITGTNYSANDTGTTITITTNANAKYLCVFYYNGATDTKTEEEIRNSIQIEKGSKANSYTPYGTTPIELCKIENQDHTIKLQDYFYPSDDKWYKHSEVGKKVITGNDITAINTNQTNTTRAKTDTGFISALVEGIGYSNYFTLVSNWGNDNVGLYFSSTNGDVWFRANKSLIGTTLGDVQAWVNSNNITLYYPLSTPTDTEITDTTLLEQLNNLEKMKLYNGITNISITPNDLTPTLKLHYNYMTGGDVVINNNDYIKSNNIIVANTPTGEQAFRITDIEKRKHKIVLKAWHISYDTKNYVIQDSYVVDKTCNQAMDHLNNATDNTSPFTTTSDIAIINSYRCVRRSLFEAFNVVLERWGGHFVRDNWNFKIMNSIGQDNGVVVRYAKNLKDIQVTYDWTNVVTKILPVGNDGLLLDEVFLYADIQYDIPYTKVVHFDQNINENDYRDEQGILDEDAYLEALKNDLRSQATLYLQENYLPQVNYSLNANLEKITDIGDTIQVKDERLGVDITTNLISYDYDCILEKYTNLEFGNFTKTISDLTSYINSQTSQIVDESLSTTRITLENELETATSQIWGVLGSSYVLNEGDKILIVDSLPKETATNVIMINSAGIGFSQTGINGTFSTALTIDGTFNTSNVNVINFTADLIKGGVLKLGSNLNQNGILEVYDEANNLIAVLNKDGLRMNAVNGAYVLINQQVGFAGYDKNDNPIYWVSEDEFHMKKSVVEEEITLVDKMRIIPITITDNGTITNDGIGFVSTL